jgi:hypothetical protein
MYKTCIYCNRNLGGNESVENFPVGRRLAFDQEKGRLWVICERCRRWNLSPLDERWEAIEECEKQFHDTPKSFSTDNIGLAQVGEGTQLVRIGRPQRREFAAWRYGREFWQRRVRNLIGTAVQVAIGIGTVIAGANLLPLVIGLRQSRVVARVRDEQGRRLYITPQEARRLKLYRHNGADGFSLEVVYRPEQKRMLLWHRGAGKRQTTALSGPTAIRAAGRVLPAVNEFGGTESQVREAVTMIEDARTPERLFASTAAEQGALIPGRIFDADATELHRMGANVRLALEMAAHEDSEQRALEGELAALEEAWREAEEIASIADSLLIPKEITEWIERHRVGAREP